MKCLKEPLSRLVNREENARGAFFEGRFRSIAILDEESLLATCAYIDLNPVAAAVAVVPETSPHTSVQQSMAHVEAQDRTEDLKAAEQGSVAAPARSSGLEEAHWLCPIEDWQRLVVSPCSSRAAERHISGRLTLSAALSDGPADGIHKRERCRSDSFTARGGASARCRPFRGCAGCDASRFWRFKQSDTMPVLVASSGWVCWECSTLET
jgi:hypothetical protein